LYIRNSPHLSGFYNGIIDKISSISYRLGLNGCFVIPVGGLDPLKVSLYKVFNIEDLSQHCRGFSNLSGFAITALIIAV
jgi:hypothetical protein